MDDTDEDGVEDSIDNCPYLKNSSQVDTDNDSAGDVCNEITDTDSDGIGNNADTDDDNDGMSDEWEIEYGLRPLHLNDALFDNVGDGLTNLDEYKANRTPLVSDDGVCYHTNTTHNLEIIRLIQNALCKKRIHHHFQI